MRHLLHNLGGYAMKLQNCPICHKQPEGKLAEPSGCYYECPGHFRGARGDNRAFATNSWHSTISVHGAEERKAVRQEILNTLEDLVGSFMYSDRRDDEDLPVGAVQRAVEQGAISVEEMIEVFARQLRKVDWA